MTRDNFEHKSADDIKTYYVVFSCIPSLVPRPFEERKGLVHIACACAGGPQKNLGYQISSYIPPFTVHIALHPGQVTMET